MTPAADSDSRAGSRAMRADPRRNRERLLEFEHLVKQLFVAMGAEAWTTIPSKDGGVDAVATSKHLFFEQFANRNRITLINGAELKQLIKEYLHKDVIPGTSPPKRLRASDNVQTGRPGPAQL